VLLLLKYEMFFNQIIFPAPVNTFMYRIFVSPEQKNIALLESSDVADIVILILSVPDTVQVQL